MLSHMMDCQSISGGILLGRDERQCPLPTLRPGVDGIYPLGAGSHRGAIFRLTVPGDICNDQLMSRKVEQGAVQAVEDTAWAVCMQNIANTN